jgi:hypothetical protein
MTANQIDLYRKMGIEKVNMNANIDVGSYAWAKYGWLPKDWPNTAWSLQTRLKHLARSLDPTQVQDIEALLSNPDPHSIWALSDIRDPWQHPHWDPDINTVGKAMLAGGKWDGTLSLTDARQMERFNDYVSKKR